MIHFIGISEDLSTNCIIEGAVLVRFLQAQSDLAAPASAARFPSERRSKNLANLYAPEHDTRFPLSNLEQPQGQTTGGRRPLFPGPHRPGADVERSREDGL